MNPLVYLSSVFFEKIGRPSSPFHIDVDDYMNGDFSPHTKIDKCFFELFINTNYYQTKNYIIDTYIPNYVHPNLETILSILNNGKTYIPPHINQKIKLIEKFCLSTSYIDFHNNEKILPIHLNFNYIDKKWVCKPDGLIAREHQFHNKIFLLNKVFLNFFNL